MEPRRRAARPGQAPPSNNSSVRVRRAATTDADEDDEFADTIDSDDDHGTRRDEQANATEAVSKILLLHRVRGLPTVPPVHLS